MKFSKVQPTDGPRREGNALNWNESILDTKRVETTWFIAVYTGKNLDMNIYNLHHFSVYEYASHLCTCTKCTAVYVNFLWLCAYFIYQFSKDYN